MNTESIESTIQAISGHPTMLGYQYLQDAVSLCIEAGSFPNRQVIQVLHQSIAEKYGTGTGNVARNIARATDDCWDHGDQEELRNIVGHKLADKPSPAELIYYLFRYLSK